MEAVLLAILIVCLLDFCVLSRADCTSRTKPQQTQNERYSSTHNNFLLMRLF